MIDKSIALAELVPNANFEIIGDKIICHSGQEVPSEEAIQAKLKELEDEYKKQAYARSRAKSYPSIKDQLDKIYHSGIDEWKKDIKAVKDKFPKPT